MSQDDPIAQAVHHLRRLPGIGEKTATRLVYWMLRAPKGLITDLAASLVHLSENVHACERCGNFTPTSPCSLCLDPRRDDTAICVVEHPQDLHAFERGGEFRGRYHVLHGALSPLDGIGPQELNLRSLLNRLRDGTVKEIIIATNPTVEGDATALYIARLLKDVDVIVSRLAHGLSVGTEIEYADTISLSRAFHNRQRLNP